MFTQPGSAQEKLGGWYSAFRGRGAVPGFQFKIKESAEAFQKYVSEGDTEGVKEQVKARRDAFMDDRSQSAIERLREMADRLEESTEEALSAVRKTNTAIRARMAANAESAAESKKAMAKTMRNIAAAIDRGESGLLDKVRTKAQVEMLLSMVNTAKYSELRDKYDSYSEYEKHKGERPTAQTADYAEFPY